MFIFRFPSLQTLVSLRWVVLGNFEKKNKATVWQTEYHTASKSSGCGPRSAFGQLSHTCQSWHLEDEKLDLPIPGSLWGKAHPVREDRLLAYGPQRLRHTGAERAGQSCPGQGTPRRGTARCAPDTCTCYRGALGARFLQVQGWGYGKGERQGLPLKSKWYWCVERDSHSLTALRRKERRKDRPLLIWDRSWVILLYLLRNENK